MTAPWWGDDPAAFSDERVIADPEPSAAEWERQFHDECGTKWSEHDASYIGAVLPFGCLPELVLRWRNGDR